MTRLGGGRAPRSARRLCLGGFVGIGIMLGTLLGAAPAASAHPLGNFTVNVYGGVIVRTDQVLVDYVVDLAEIPAYQARGAIDVDGDGTVATEEAGAWRDERCGALAGGVQLSLDGRRVRLASTRAAISFPAGAGGLSTLRLECRLEAALAQPIAGPTTLSYVDANYAGRLGWREVTAAGDGVTLLSADVPSVSVSDRLRSYPRDALSPGILEATLRARGGGPRLASLPGPGQDSAAAAAPGRDAGILAALAGRPDASPLLIGLMVIVAIGVGALHALGPGHGKALIGAALVAGRASVRQAVAIGGAVSVMHTTSVLGLGLLVVTAERVLPPERVYPWLGLASGLAALALGSWLLVGRLHATGWRRSGGHDRGGAAGHDHPHPHGAHDHGVLSRPGLVALAFSGGILPSPSALVVLLTSISLGRTWLGLVLIAAFSAGLAASLIGVGLLAVRAKASAARRLPRRVMAWAPVASAAAIAVIGVGLTARGLLQI
jgi:ABC-type nickel/cobalt efflux system permease component RcnA